MSDFDSRFGGIGRLLGREGLDRLRRAHVCVIGIGGVGSWAVEALARSGVGALTLIDLDEICITNVNRQLHALDGEIGRPKTDVMAIRTRAIHPECRVNAITEYITKSNADRLLAPSFDFVVDAIDSVATKAALIAACRQRDLPVVSVGAAGGRKDPTRIRVADLSETTHDRLLQLVRKELRRDYDFPRGRASFGVTCVYSPEPCLYPKADGCVSERRTQTASGLRLNCESGYGTASFVTGTFGFVAAAQVVTRLGEGTKIRETIAVPSAEGRGDDAPPHPT